ncbi:MAG: hypothetical protein H0U28_01550 [Nocardioidaceae bacterium]|nr:hypothetical protein [Nocardioidaceae bacterium]
MMWRRVSTSGWTPMAATVLGLVVISLCFHVQPSELAAFSAYVAGAVALPGVFAWRLLYLRGERDEHGAPTWFEDLSLGTILGFGIQLPVYVVGVFIGAPLLFLALPALVIVLTPTRFGRRVWTAPTSSLDARASWGIAAITLYAVSWLFREVVVLAPLTLRPNRLSTVDEAFHQALTAELSHRFPPQIPFLLDTRLDYHWFVHAQLAATRHATGVESTVLLRVLVPALLLALTVVGIAAIVLRLTRRPVVAVVAPGLLVAGGFHLLGPHYAPWEFTESVMTARWVGSPSQSYGTVMALPAILLILEVLRPDRRPSRFTWILLIIALLALSGAKATFMPIFLCGAIAVWLVHLLVNGRIDRIASALVALVLVVTLFAQFVLFGGRSGAMAFDPFETVRAALYTQGIPATTDALVAMTLTLLVGWLLYGAGGVGLLQGGRWRDPRVIWLVVSVAAGISVAFAFSRAGYSQVWFQRSTAELVVILSGWGLALLLPEPLTRKHALVGSGVAASAGLMAFAASSIVEAANDTVRLATYGSVLLTAIAPILIVAVFLVVRLVTRGSRRARRPGIAVLVVFLLGLGLTSVISFGYDTVTGRPLAQATPDASFAPGGAAAGAWIAEHSGVYDVVATNVHCVEPGGVPCDNRSFWVSAQTERRIVVEGWGYTQDTNANHVPGVPAAHLPIPDTKRLAVNDAAFEQPSAQTVSRLVEEYDVAWLFVSRAYDADIAGLSSLTGLLQKSFHNENYVVFKVRT